MRVGLCFDLRNPPAWRIPGERVCARALERAQQAEEAGIDSLWCSEHHFFEDGYLPQPFTFAAALAARTTRVRIGTGIVVAPLHHPIDIAEQAAVVDLVSGGRLELGLGAGYMQDEFAAYGVDHQSRMRLFEAHVREVQRRWASDLSPRPVQPEAPLWLGVHGPRGARLAGRLGAGLLRLDAELLDDYRSGLVEGGHDPSSQARLAGPAGLVVSGDPERAWSRIVPHLEYQWNSYAWYAASPADRGAKPSDGAGRTLRAEDLRSSGPAMTSPAFDVVTPDDAVERLTRWLDGLPVAEVYFWESIAGMPDDLADEHIELLGTEVAPRLASDRHVAPC